MKQVQSKFLEGFGFQRVPGKQKGSHIAYIHELGLKIIAEL